MYIVVIALLLVSLYYLYNWLYGPSDIQDVVIWSDTTVGLSTKNKVTSITASGSATVQTGPTGGTLKTEQVPYIYSGGEYTISTWIYVTKWDNNGNKPFLTLSGGANQYNTVVLFLGKNTNKLGVRVSYSASSSNNACAGLLTVPGSSCITGNTPSEYTNMLNYSSNSSLPVGGPGNQGYQDDVMPMADIEEVDLQRWVNITVVMMGKTVDVYVDGKLSRSTVLPGFFKSDGDTITSSSTSTGPQIRLGEDKSFSGYLGMTRAANMAYTPDRVYANYQKGPFDGWSLSSLDPSQYSLTVKRNEAVLFSTSRY
jgi:hypothetical protein